MTKYLIDRIDYHHIDPANPAGSHYHRTGWGESVEIVAGPIPCRGPTSTPRSLYRQGYLVRRANGHHLFVEDESLSDHEICEGCGEPSPEGLRLARYAPTDTRDTRLCPQCLAASLEPAEDLHI
jgi:hypothetical protein